MTFLSQIDVKHYTSEMQNPHRFRQTVSFLISRCLFIIVFLVESFYLNCFSQVQAQIHPSGQISLQIIYPKGIAYDNVVENGTPLQIIGLFYSPERPIVKIQVLIAGKMVKEVSPRSKSKITVGNKTIEIPPNNDIFVLNIDSFGSEGENELIVRVVDELGNFAEAQVKVNNNPELVKTLSRDFLKKCFTNEKLLQEKVSGERDSEIQLMKFESKKQIPLSKTKKIKVFIDPELKAYQQVIREAFDFWRINLGIKFEFIWAKKADSEVEEESDWYIKIEPRFNNEYASSQKAINVENSLGVAQRYFYYTSEGSSGNKRTEVYLAWGKIYLYQRWRHLEDYGKEFVLVHETGHLFNLGDSYGENGIKELSETVMDSCFSPFFLRPSLRLHPYQWKALRIAIGLENQESLR
jgi:hypothetical protein